MKKLILLSIAGILTIGAHAQKVKEADVPVAVKSGFTKQYASVSKIAWEKEGDNYEAEFDYDKAETSVLISITGNILETETEIGVDKLPAGVSTYVAAHYAGKKITEAAKIIDEKGTITYEAELKDMDLLFDDKGNFIKEVKEDKKD